MMLSRCATNQANQSRRSWRLLLCSFGFYYVPFSYNHSWKCVQFLDGGTDGSALSGPDANAVEVFGYKSLSRAAEVGGALRLCLRRSIRRVF